MLQNPHSIFLTGITGAAGGRLAAEALRGGAHVTALVRDTSLTRARLRVEQSLIAAGAPEFASSVEIVLGDITTLDPHDAPLRQRLAGLGLVIHCAARVEFAETPGGLLRRTNVEGTRRILALTAALGAALVYVSTAYVAGSLTGPSDEDSLPAVAAFNNPYDQSKHEAEGLARDWAASTGLSVTILRPSILLGDYAQGVTPRFNTLYNTMQAFDRIAPLLGRDPIRVEAERDATKNFLPLDIFGQEAWHIISRAAPGCYHLTHPRPVSFGALRDIFARLFGMDNIELVETGFFRKNTPTRTERLYHRSMAQYRPYVRHEPIFDRRRADRALAGSGILVPDLDYDYFHRLLAYARSTDWQPPARTDVEPPVVGAAPLPGGVESYFTGFLAGKIGHQLLPDLRHISATLAIVLTDAPDGRPWILDIREGALQSIGRNTLHPQCAYRLDRLTFGQIVSGRLEPQKAFFERRVDLEGDMETGLRLAFILAAFFRHYPYQIGEGERAPAG